MFRPVIKETEESKAIVSSSHDALVDASLTDDQADAIINENNAKLLALGFSKGYLTVSRKDSPYTQKTIKIF